MQASGVHMFDVLTKWCWWLKWQGSNEESLASLLLFASKTWLLQGCVKVFSPLFNSSMSREYKSSLGSGDSAKVAKMGPKGPLSVPQRENSSGLLHLPNTCMAHTPVCSKVLPPEGRALACTDQWVLWRPMMWQSEKEGLLQAGGNEWNCPKWFILVLPLQNISGKSRQRISIKGYIPLCLCSLGSFSAVFPALCVRSKSRTSEM